MAPRVHATDDTSTNAATARRAEWLGLAGRVIVVSGAGSGIGRALAESLAEAGAKVAVLDRDANAAHDTTARIEQSGGCAIAVEADISNETSVRSAAAKVRAELGPVHGLVNNAGLLRAGALSDVSIDEWNQVLAVNLTGYLICTREFGKDMVAAGAGSVVHVASISAIHPQTASGAYSASKAGVLLMSKQFAAEWGPKGIRSNAICPGMIRTALSAKFYEEPGFEARRAAVTASRRVGEPLDIVEPAMYLLSDRAAYVNGTELVVDGGLDCMLMDMVPRPGFNRTADAAQA
ncbi:MAG: SDR family oxidoreductase [Burkholderiales bacterium]